MSPNPYSSITCFCIGLSLLCNACSLDESATPIPEDDAIVTVDEGAVHGAIIGLVRVFYGIPYAAPPVGELRFRSPQPAPAWTETLDATSAGPLCPQGSPFGAEPIANTSEDCLQLNVWTPYPVPSERLPVMVWLHGGGFVSGSGDFFGAYAGTHLVPEGNVVLVTVNYRLGPFGFLAHPSLTAEDPTYPSSGNYGMEDQRAALEWVQRNIAAFGGDAANVTLFGESAGGTSVCAQLAMDQGMELFHRAIMESGPCMMGPLFWAEEQGQALASTLGCDEVADIPSCLRAASTSEVLSALPPASGFLFGGGATWGPNVDQHIIASAPVTALQEGQFEQVPLLIGSNRDEGGLFLLLAGLQEIDEAEYEGIIAESAVMLGAAAEDILAEYPASEYDSPAAALAAVFGEALFNCPARRLARAVSATSTPAFLYHFVREVDSVLFPGLGAYHSAELPFVFGTTVFGAELAAEDAPLVTAIEGYWTQFAHGGDPNSPEAPPWPVYEEATDQHLELDLTISTGSRLRQAKCDFWDGQ